MDILRWKHFVVDLVSGFLFGQKIMNFFFFFFFFLVGGGVTFWADGLFWGLF